MPCIRQGCRHAIWHRFLYLQSPAYTSRPCTCNSSSPPFRCSSSELWPLLCSSCRKLSEGQSSYRGSTANCKPPVLQVQALLVPVLQVQALLVPVSPVVQVSVRCTGRQRREEGTRSTRTTSTSRNCPKSQAACSRRRSSSRGYCVLLRRSPQCSPYTAYSPIRGKRGACDESCSRRQRKRDAWIACDDCAQVRCACDERSKRRQRNCCACDERGSRSQRPPLHLFRPSPG